MYTHNDVASLWPIKTQKDKTVVVLCVVALVVTPHP